MEQITAAAQIGVEVIDAGVDNSNGDAVARDSVAVNHIGPDPRDAAIQIRRVHGDRCDNADAGDTANTIQQTCVDPYPHTVITHAQR